MPLTRFSRSYVRAHIRQWLMIYLLGVIAMCFLNHYIFSATRPTVPESNSLLVYLLGEATDAAQLDEIAGEALAEAQRRDPSVQSLSFEDIPFTGQSDLGSTLLLSVRVVTGRGDLYLCSEAGFRALAARGGCRALDDCLDADWMQRTGAEPVPVTDVDSGETAVRALKFATLKRLKDAGGFAEEPVYLAVATGANNLESTLIGAEALIDTLTE